MLSGLAIDDNDPLARRDQGLEFLDVTAQCMAAPTGSGDAWRITNIGTSVIDTNLLVIVKGLQNGATLQNASGTTSGGDPYLRLYLSDGVLNPGDSVVARLSLSGQTAAPKLALLSGQGREVSYR